jgi:hypothetical protein
MNANRTQELKWKVETNAQTLARALRTAIMFCSKVKGYEQYKDLTLTFKICTQNEWLIVKPRARTPIERESQKALRMGKQILEEALSVEQIVGFLVQNNPKEVYFPQVVLNDVQMKQLYEYCKKNNLFIINQEEAGITITIEDKDNLAWEPK